MIKSKLNNYRKLIDEDREHGRYLSWEHCYKNFHNARKNKNKNVDTDYLTLQLAFFLASWGMYRGSSFLLRKDYLVHKEVVKEILKSKYDCLDGITCDDLVKPENLELLFELVSVLKNYYDDIRKKVKKKESKTDVSSILVTKVLLGTLACVPAYDTNFKKGVRANINGAGKFNEDSVKKLAQFYFENRDVIESSRNDYKIGNLSYPQMKMVDMIFWQAGRDMKK